MIAGVLRNDHGAVTWAGVIESSAPGPFAQIVGATDDTPNSHLAAFRISAAVCIHDSFRIKTSVVS